MAIFDIFKKKTPKKKEKPKKVEKPSPPVPKAKRKVTGVAPLVLQQPHITEKATDLTKNNQYVFRVFPRANKQEIKKGVEESYGVEVVKVRLIKVPRKQRRLGRTIGFRKGYKKAIVTLKPGQKIELLPR